jgi:two-component system response regulator AtoC
VRLDEGKTAERMEPARFPARERPALRLLVLDGSSMSAFDLPASGTVVVGRAADAHLRVADPSVSRRHAEFVIESGKTLVKDLGSSHGTLVNGERIADARTLSVGDIVSIGDVTLAVRSEARAARPAPFVPEDEMRRRLGQEIERSLRYGRPLAVLEIATAASHLDRPAFEAEVTSRMRLMDFAGWSPGVHLTIVAPELSEQEARVVAKRLLAGVLPFCPDARLGVSTCPMDGCDPDTLVASARAAAGAAERGEIAAAAEMVTTLEVEDRRLVVADPTMARLYALVRRLAASDLTILVTGETGVGKENVALAVHAWSSRSKARFVAINGAAMPDTLVESELFGFEKGAFSGALREKPGLLESASGGTLFLDEVGDLSPAAQAKLLRVLETRKVMRLGDVKERDVDVRIVAATNRELETEVRAGRFRQDLYFRLSGASVLLPPLRERPREVPVLAQRFLMDACARAGRPAVAISAPAMRRLVGYAWPGNVRELKNVMEVAAATILEETLEPHHLPERFGGREASAAAPAPAPERAAAAEGFRPLSEELAELERTRIAEALEAAGGVQSRAAELIGMPRRTFLLKLKKYDLVSSGPRRGRGNPGHAAVPHPPRSPEY